LISDLLGLVGAVLGGLVGFYTFGWLKGNGYYGMMIPGALLGLGCSLGARHRSTFRGILCGLAALLLSLYAEWWFMDASTSTFMSFLTRVKDLESVTLMMIGVGTLIAFWLGKDSRESIQRKA
jgi:hypothetical protein